MSVFTDLGNAPTIRDLRRGSPIEIIVASKPQNMARA